MKKDSITVLSLFDGISGGFVALQRAQVEIKDYFSSEIDKSAISVQDHHYSADSRFHKIGDVCKVNGADYADCDLVIFGSPCINLSSINKTDRSGLEGPDSKLFYEAIRILKEIKANQPKGKELYVLAENVASMDLKNRRLITQELEAIFPDIKMLRINSSLVSVSNRRRLYWTNIPNARSPLPNGKKYQEVLVNGYADREKANVILSSNVTLTNGLFRYYKMNLGNIIFREKGFAELSPEAKLELYPGILKESGYDGKAKRGKDEYEFVNGCYRQPSVLELERMMSFPDGYISGVDGVSRTEKMKLVGLSFTVDMVRHLLSPLRN